LLARYNICYNKPIKQEAKAMKTVKITKIGNSAGIILSTEMLAILGVKQGDDIYPVQTPNGIELRPYDAEFSKKVDSAREVMNEYREVFHELAKR
jgi:putative addiction module antidote